MKTREILDIYYGPETKAHDAAETLIMHSGLVAKKAVEIARGMGLTEGSIKFVEEAAWLHDIGIHMTNAPDLGCHGIKPYILHGILGREILESHGLLAHALVCERHVGAGLTAEEIKDSGLPLPVREMLPRTMEEKIVCVADKFFRKSIADSEAELTVEDALAIVKRYGPGPSERFGRWLNELGLAG